MTEIKNIDVEELVGQFIDIFEDFLDKKSGEIKPTKTDVFIKGKDYDDLASSIKDTLVSWDLIKGE